MAAGYDVHSLGMDVHAERLVQAVADCDADILALSALLTDTAGEDKKVIDLLAEGGLRTHVKVMFGGGAINSDFATAIGADSYAPSATGAVQLAQSFVGAG